MQLLSLPDIKMELYLDFNSLMSHSISVILLSLQKMPFEMTDKLHSEKIVNLIILLLKKLQFKIVTKKNDVLHSCFQETSSLFLFIIVFKK